MSEKVIIEKLEGLKELFNEKFKQNKDQHDAITEELNKKASKWTEKVLGIGMLGCFSWVVGQLLALIPQVEAFFN